MTLSPSDVMLCIDPFTYHFEHDVLFDAGFASLQGENIMAPYIHLREWFAARGVRVHTADRLLRREVGAKVNVVMSFGLWIRTHTYDRTQRIASMIPRLRSAFIALSG